MATISVEIPDGEFCNESFKDKKCRDIVKKWLEMEVEE